MKTSYNEIPAYITQDGSLIRELMHPATHLNHNQSLAEAIIEPGKETILHRHICAEELYYIMAGTGLMVLGDQQIETNAGDAICIHPGIAHKIRNTGKDALRILCCCAPAYQHSDTELLE